MDPLLWLAWFLSLFDGFTAHTSGGKDSMLTVQEAVRMLGAFGLLDRLAVLHLVLDRDRDIEDPRVEWQEVPQLAAEQAGRCGIPLGGDGGWEVWDTHLAGGRLTSREQWAGRMHYARRDFRITPDPDQPELTVPGDLLDDMATRRKQDGGVRGFPRVRTRYCTSDWKTAVGRAWTEAVCQQIRDEQGLRRPVRILQFMGFRAEESTERARRPVLEYRRRISAPTIRQTVDFLPIHDLTLRQVWQRIRESGMPYHPVYDEGSSRLSCRRCVFASRQDLSIARRLDPVGHDAYVAVEQRIGDEFQYGRPLASITAQPGEAGFDVHWLTCPTCGVRVLAHVREPRRWCPAHTDGLVPAAVGEPTGQCALFDLETV